MPASIFEMPVGSASQDFHVRPARVPVTSLAEASAFEKRFQKIRTHHAAIQIAAIPLARKPKQQPGRLTGSPFRKSL